MNVIFKKRTLNFVLLLAIFAFLTSPLLAQNNDDGWEYLFNGKNLDGWQIIGDKGEAYVDSGEIIIHRKINTKVHTYLTTEKEYDDFILEVDFKMDATGWSSGVIIRCFGEKSTLDSSKVKLFGYQIKIDNSDRLWTGGIFHDHGGSVKWLYDLSDNEPARMAYKSHEWNNFRIEAMGNNTKVWINGVPSANLINNEYTKGFIALKIHSLGANIKEQAILIHFKNVRIQTKNMASHAQVSGIKEIVVE